jgi:hypothetical protein
MWVKLDSPKEVVDIITRVEFILAAWKVGPFELQEEAENKNVHCQGGDYWAELIVNDGWRENFEVEARNAKSDHGNNVTESSIVLVVLILSAWGHWAFRYLSWDAIQEYGFESAIQEYVSDRFKGW